ncbi:MAG: transporter substrate-binding domain-containing protein [Alphaproteobacteria bacterium]|nr:transporter substrate-binding domain-containing protein [Alphaproteobacteria bacterium]
MTCRSLYNFVLFLSFWLVFAAPTFATDRAVERIRKTNEIHCGVYVLGSLFSYSTEGKPQGFTVDLMNEISEKTGVSVKYTEISSFATIFEDLKTGHYDMICTPLLLLPATALKALPGNFLINDSINIYGDSAVDYSKITEIEQLNNNAYIFVGMDNELGGIYAPKLFPQAKLNTLPLGTPPSNMFLEVFSRKANFVVLSHLAELAYSQENPGKLKRVTNHSLFDASVRLFYPEDSYVLRTNIEAVIDDLKRDGTLDRIIKKNGLDK